MTSTSQMDPVLANLATHVVLDYFNHHRDRKRRIDAGTPPEEIPEVSLGLWVHDWIAKWADTYKILKKVKFPE